MSSHRSRVASMFLAAGILLPAGSAAAALSLEAQIAELQRVLAGKRVGLLTCPTSVDSNYTMIADRLRADPKIRLVCFFAPEHGLRGDRQAGDDVEDYVDETTGLPVYSVYGNRQSPMADRLAPLDVLVCDMQEVGVRFYTCIWIAAQTMETAARAGKEFVLFDRPNPIGLARMEGAPITFDGRLIGPLYPGQPLGVPTRHGMTMGEILNLVNAEWTASKARLTVVKIPGYTRTMTFEETGYPWVLPSPNIPTVDTAVVYPGTCIFEGSNLSEGRGTTRPFELIGAPFINGDTWAAKLNAVGLKGVRFRPAGFTPSFEDHAGQRCGGVQVHVTDRDTFDPIRTGLTMLKVVCDLYPREVEVTDYASRLMGVPNLRDRIRTESVDAIIAGWQENLKKFEALRRPHLLYP